MSYAATAFVRLDDSWVAHDLDLDDVEDIDETADRLRDVAEEEGRGAGGALLFVEEDDEWFGIVRVDDRDPRTFLSDARVLAGSRLASALFADAPAYEPADEDEEGPPARVEPAGDADILADLGSPEETLIALCSERGLLPADVIAALCERAGCLPELEELREA